MADTYELDISKNLINANYITSYIDTKLTELENSMLDKICGVGEILITTREGNPSTWLGRGTWEQIKEGVTLLSAGSTYTVNSEGGEASHSITEAEMPRHTHTQETHSHGKGSMRIQGKLDSEMPQANGNGSYYTGSGAFFTTNDVEWSWGTNYVKQGTAHTTAWCDTNRSGAWTGVTEAVAPAINPAGENQPLSLIQPYIAVYIWRRSA